MNNEQKMVMVPHELLKRCIQPVCEQADWDKLKNIAAEQHQGEPVLLPMRRSWSGIAGWRDQAEIKAWNACLDEIAKLGPLYTHADPGEVERLRNCLRTEVEAGDSWKREADELRAHLAEWDALLDDIAKRHWSGVDFDLPADLVARIKSLSASAEPSASIIHPINMKTMMQAYEKVDHKAMLHGTSNWCAAMATSLRGVLQAEPSAPVERGDCESCDDTGLGPCTVCAALSRK